LRAAFPAATGFSPRNLRDMKRFYLAYTDEVIWRQPVAKLAESTASRRLLIRRQPVTKLRQHTKWPQVVAKVGSETVIEILQQLIAKIPWGHNLLILNKLSDPAARLYYLRAAVRSVLPEGKAGRRGNYDGHRRLFEARAMKASYAATADRAREEILAMIPKGTTVFRCGSMTAAGIGLWEAIPELPDVKLIDPYRPELSREEGLGQRRLSGHLQLRQTRTSPSGKR